VQTLKRAYTTEKFKLSQNKNVVEAVEIWQCTSILVRLLTFDVKEFENQQISLKRFSRYRTQTQFTHLTNLATKR